jgi:translation initiation factor IF-2
VVKRDAQVRVVRDRSIVYTSKLSSLKRFKDDASEVRAGYECGLGIANFNDVKVGDVLECFRSSRFPPPKRLDDSRPRWTQQVITPGSMQ